MNTHCSEVPTKQSPLFVMRQGRASGERNENRSSNSNIFWEGNKRNEIFTSDLRYVRKFINIRNKEIVYVPRKNCRAYTSYLGMCRYIRRQDMIAG